MTAGPAPIHIVGLYKCGTTWLLRALAAHPQVIAWREFDPVLAARAPDRRLRARPALALDYVHPRPTRAWMARREAGQARAPAECFERLFLGQGWIPLMGAQLQDAARALPRDDVEALLDGLLGLAGAPVRASDASPLRPADHESTLGFRYHRRADLLELMQQVRDARSADAVPGLVYDNIARQVAPGTVVAHKAADQLMQFEALRAAVPRARFVAVIRDGRDAAISARHFEALMRKRGAPFRVARTGALRRLLGWSVRASKLAEHVRRGEVTAVRYEDLHADFEGTCATLFRHLGLDDDPVIVARVGEATDFRAMTAGRERGESAEAIVRRGITGEWREVFSPVQAALAWRAAGRALEAFGYTPDGDIRRSPLVLAPAPAAQKGSARPPAARADTSP